MRTAPVIESEFAHGQSLLSSAVRELWKAIRLPIAAVVLLLEPIVGFICGLGLMLGVLTSILFEMSAVGPKFPFVKVIGISFAFGVILFLYYGLASIFVKD